MVVEGHARERREWLALTPGGKDEDLLRPVVVDLRELDHRSFGDVKVPEVPGDVDVLLHGSPGDGELAAVQESDLDGLLHAVDVRGEAGHDDAPLGLGEDLMESLADDAL